MIVCTPYCHVYSDRETWLECEQTRKYSEEMKTSSNRVLEFNISLSALGRPALILEFQKLGMSRLTRESRVRVGPAIFFIQDLRVYD